MMDDDTLRNLLDKASAMGACRGRLEGLMDMAEFVATRVEESGGCKPSELVPYLGDKIKANSEEYENLAKQGRELVGL